MPISPEIKAKMMRFYSEDHLRVMELLQDLSFAVSSVNPKIFKGITLNNFENNDFYVEWLPIDGYLYQNEVLAKMEEQNKVPVTPVEFIGNLSKMDDLGPQTRICLFQFEKYGWAHLAANGWIQKTICSILSGDGFGPNCLFAVKSKNAP